MRARPLRNKSSNGQLDKTQNSWLSPPSPTADKKVGYSRGSERTSRQTVAAGPRCLRRSASCSGERSGPRRCRGQRHSFHGRWWLASPALRSAEPYVADALWRTRLGDPTPTRPASRRRSRQPGAAVRSGNPKSFVDNPSATFAEARAARGEVSAGSPFSPTDSLRLPRLQPSAG